MTVTSTALDNNIDKENRRHINPRLEIDTSNNNNEFFNMSTTTSTPRPPPSISRKISIRKSSVDINPPKTPSTSVPPMSPKIDEDGDLHHYDSYANRLRNLVSRLHNEQELQSLPTPLLPPQSPSKEHFFPTPKNDMLGQQIESFRILKLIGVGAFSKVYLAQHVDTCQFFALKVIHKSLLDDTRVRSTIEREVGILKNIDHPNIVKIEAILETDETMCIVLEYIEGEELFETVKSMHQNSLQLDEQKVKDLFLQLLRAVQWLHEHNIVHRDLKLENILIHKNEKNQDIVKITDFGLARIIDPENPLLVTRCGSEEYAAPEIIQQQHYDGRKTDVWSLGIILYALLVGYLPFRYDPRKHERVSKLFYRIVRADIKWPKQAAISDDAKFVVKSILETRPNLRMSIHDIEQLPWF